MVGDMEFNGGKFRGQSLSIWLRIEMDNEYLGRHIASRGPFQRLADQNLPESAMTTERVATRVSDAEMTRRWDAVRKLMRERGIQALVAYHTEDWLGGHARWFTDIPTHNGYGRSIVFHADDLMTVVQQGSFDTRPELAGKDIYQRGVGEIRHTPFFSSVRYTTGYHADIVREVIQKRGYKTIGFVLPETMPHKLVNAITEGFEG